MWHHLLVIGNPPQVPALLWAVAADTNSWKQHSKSYVITTCIQVPGGWRETTVGQWLPSMQLNSLIKASKSHSSHIIVPVKGRRQSQIQDCQTPKLILSLLEGLLTQGKLFFKPAV